MEVVDQVGMASCKKYITIKGEYPGKSTVTFLPMIDMDPSNNNCIYSTLKFVCRMARKYEMTAILTMDQPL